MLKCGNTTVIFQDFSAAVIHKRFDRVKKRLKVSYHGSSKMFDDPVEVEQNIGALDEAAAGSG